MDTLAATDGARLQRSALKNLVTILIWPRATFRRILEQPRDRMVIPLLLLSALASSLGEDDTGFRKFTATAEPLLIAAVIAVGLIVGCLVLLLLFYLLAWIVTLVGRALDGSGNARAVRSALAWGLVPSVWSLLYKIPLVIFVRHYGPPRAAVKTQDFTWDPGVFAGGCATALVYVLLELLLFAWFLYITSNTLAEAHKFSAWKGLGTLVITVLIPIIVALAAVLAAAT